jgi:hypothetical protein
MSQEPEDQKGELPPIDEILNSIDDGSSPLPGNDVPLIDVSIDEEAPAQSPKQEKPKALPQKPAAPAPVSPAPEPESPDIGQIYGEKFRRALDLIGNIAEDILSNCVKDRSQIQDVIDHYYDIVTAGGKVSPAYVEGLVQAIKNKSEISLTAVRTLDSLTKFLSVSKGNEMLVSQMNVSIDVAELTKLLDQNEMEEKKRKKE